MLAEKVFEFIKSHSLVQSQDQILIAYSGGPDSTCLLHLFHERWRNCAAVYVNHNLRGQESEREQRFVTDFCKGGNIPLFIETIQWKNKPASNVEETARRRRYRHFAKVAAEHGFDRVALAHNKDDAAETVLQRLARGSGPAGLAGIPMKRGIYIRPLLECSRAEILQYLDANAIQYFTDTTNASLEFQRNKIRHELIPYLQKNFNPAVIDALLRSSHWIKEQNALVLELLEPYARIIRETETGVEIDRGAFLRNTPLLRKALLRLAIHRADPSLHPESRTLTTLLESIDSQKTLQLPGYLQVSVSGDSISFGRKKTPGTKEVDVAKEGTYPYPPANQTLVFTVIDVGKIRSDRKVAFVDADKASFPLYIRNMRRGDAFQPLGMEGHKKLSDFYIDRKIPRDERKRIPLVLKDDEIVWVAGHQINNQYRVTGNTKRILQIEIRDDA